MDESEALVDKDAAKEADDDDEDGERRPGEAGLEGINRDGEGGGCGSCWCWPPLC